jgi:hypothetical protein
MAKGSRYQHALPFTTQSGQAVEFRGFRARAIGPATGIIEYVVTEDDRLDLLALNFYVDSRKWWRILDANPEIVFADDLSLPEFVGATILIPGASEPGDGR